MSQREIPFPDIRPRTFPSAGHLNRLSDAVERISSIWHPELQEGGFGYVLPHPDIPWLYGKITAYNSSNDSYSWSQVIPDELGNWTDLPDGASGDEDTLPAFEFNQRILETFPAYVVLWKTPGNAVYFDESCGGGNPRWIPAKNVGSQTIPAYGLVRVTDVDTDDVSMEGLTKSRPTDGDMAEILWVNQPDTNGQDVVVNGPTAIIAGDYGVVSRDWPLYALYEDGDGLPANGETWGPGYVSAPVQAAAVAASGGSLSNGQTYYWVITATDANGETVKSNEVSLAITSPNQTANLSWSQPSGATGYKVYRSTVAGSYGATSLVTTITPGSTVTYSDTGSALSSGSPPATNGTYSYKLRKNRAGFVILGGPESVLKIVLVAPPSWPPMRVRKNSGATTFARHRLNLIEGSNITLTVADDSVDDEVDVTIAASSGGSVTVREADGSPSYASSSTITFDQADGFVVSQPGAGEARIDMTAASGSTVGIVTLSGQTLGAGEKTVDSLVSTTTISAGTTLSSTQGATINSGLGTSSSSDFTVLAASSIKLLYADISAKLVSVGTALSDACDLYVSRDINVDDDITAQGTVSGDIVVANTNFTCSGFSGISTTINYDKAGGGTGSLAFVGGILTSST